MTYPHLELIAVPVPLGSLDIMVEVANAPLPIGMRLRCLRSDVANGLRQARPRLPSFPPVAPFVPAIGATALTMVVVRNRRRSSR